MKAVGGYLGSVVFLAGLIAVDVIYVRWAWFGNANADVAARAAIGVVLGVMNLVLVTNATRALLSAMKGGVRVEFSRRPYTWGEEIAGEVILVTRKRLDLERLTVTLRAEREVRREKSRSWVTAFETSVDVMGAENLMTGEYRKKFSVRLPSEPPVDAARAQAEQLLKGFGPIGGFLKNAFDTRLRWRVEARAHVAGVDIEAREDLRFNDQAWAGR